MLNIGGLWQICEATVSWVYVSFILMCMWPISHDYFMIQGDASGYIAYLPSNLKEAEKGRKKSKGHTLPDS